MPDDLLPRPLSPSVWPRPRSAGTPARTALAPWVAGALCALPLAALAQNTTDAPPPSPPAPSAPAPSAAPAPALAPLRATGLLQETIPDAQRAQMPTFVFGDRIEGQADVRTVIEGNAELRLADTVIRAQRM